MNTDQNKYRDEAWDFRGANTKEYTHCFHNYPAMMVPQIVRSLLDRHGVEGGWLLDPYCGTGTSLVEASTFGMNNLGCDINPLARMIATAKTTPIALSTLDCYLNSLIDLISQTKFSKIPNLPVPDILNRDYWFSADVIKCLSFLRYQIELIPNQNVRNFFWIAFSETVRDCSYTRNGEFKLHRISTAKMDRFNPNVFSTFELKLIRNRRGLEQYLDKCKDMKSIICDANTALGESPELDHGFDLVITSPPYGDSQTTVAYGQFSRLSSEWIGLPDARMVDRRSMGGYRHNNTFHLGLGPIQDSLKRIREIDEIRANDVVAFYVDLERSIETIVSLLAKHATVCYVVGNRRVKGITLPTDRFVIDRLSYHGLYHIETVVRTIPNKRMPKKNSPSNIAGKTDLTMHEENIVIAQR